MSLNKPDSVIKRVNFKWEEVELSIEVFKNKVISMIMWWAIWDAMWVPVEMKTYKYIQENHGRVDDYLDSSLNIFFNKWWLASGKKWLISDDTILTLAGVNSILETGNIDFDNILKHSINWYKNFPYWFGKWTTKALEKYEILESQNPGNNNYIDLWDKLSSGNGVAMKQSPYSAYFLGKNFSNESIDENMKILANMTHWHSTTIVASLVHNHFLIELLKANDDTKLDELLIYLINYSRNIEQNMLADCDDSISDLLEKLLDDYSSGWLQSYDEILSKYWWWDKRIWASGYVLTTLWIVYSIFLNKQDFNWLLDSINIGWDTDSFAAIIWNMIWAYKWKFYSDYHQNWVEKSNENFTVIITKTE